MRRAAFLLWAVLLGGLASASPAQETPELRWSQLPPLPDAEGFAGAFAGVSHGALLVAGGANFPGEKWGAAPAKQWHAGAYVLERPDGAWRAGLKLPRPLGYGVSITVDERVLCIGGSDEARHYAEVFALEWRAGTLLTAPLPPLPEPCAQACGALVGRTIYVAGGLAKPDSTVALKNFRAFDLDQPARGWRVLPPWPGPERMLAVAGSRDGDFYLFSGTRLHAGPDGQPVREVLRDAYRYHAGAWTRLADLPRAAVAALSPAIPWGKSALLVCSGDTGANAALPPSPQHPGFPREVLAYDTGRDAWSVAGEAPGSRATATVVPWLGRWIVPSGEIRPRVRSPEVWALEGPR